MQKKILLYPAGLPQKEAFLEAKNMGLYIVTVDRNPESPCFELADEAFTIDPNDHKDFVSFVTKFHQEKNLDGILLVGADIPESLAKATEAVGLVGISATAAALTVNKLASKQKFRSAGIPIPDFYQIESPEQVKDIVQQKKAKMIIKPNDNCGARGVTQIGSDSDMETSFKKALSYAKDKKVILEEFLQGQQISIEGLVQNNKVFVTGFADRNYEFLEKYKPYIIENGATMPSALTQEQQQEVKNTFIDGIKALGIDNSVAKGDMVYTKNGAYVIEIAGRISGGKFASQLVPEATGVNLLKLAIKNALGEKINQEETIPKHQRAVAVRYLMPEPGLVKQIKGIDEIKKMPCVNTFDIWIKPGDKTPVIKSHPDRSGVFVVTGKSIENVYENIKNVYENLYIEVIPTY